MSKARQDFDIRYDHDNDWFYMWNKSGGQNFIAKANSSLYVIEEYEPKEMTMYNITSMTGTERAFKLHEALDHPYTPYLIKAIKGGFFKGWKVTVKDIVDAKLDTCVGCTIGKDSRRAKKDSTRDEEVQNDIGENLHVDIIYLNRKPERTMYLLTVEELTGFANLYKVSSRQREELLQAIITTIGFYRSHGHTTKVIHADRESALATIESDLNKNGYRLVQVAPNVHEKIAERMVRSIRNRWRSTLYGLGYKLPAFLYQHLLFHVVMSMNSTPNAKTGKNTPRTLVTGRQIKEYVKYSFGSVGYFREPEPNGSSAPRRRLGIYIGKEAESRAMKAYMFDTKTMVVRDDFVPVEVTQEIKEMINNLTTSLDPPIPIEDIIESESYKSTSKEPNVSVGVAPDTGLNSSPSDERMNEGVPPLKQGEKRTELVDVDDPSGHQCGPVESNSEKSLEFEANQSDSSDDPPVNTLLPGGRRGGVPIPTALVPASRGGLSEQPSTAANEHHPFDDRRNNEVDGKELTSRNPRDAYGEAARAQLRNVDRVGITDQHRRPIVVPTGGDKLQPGSGDVGTKPTSIQHLQPPKTAMGLARSSSVGEIPPSVSEEKLSEQRPLSRKRNKPILKIGGVASSDVPRRSAIKRRRVTFSPQLEVGGVELSRNNAYRTRTGRDTKVHDFKRLSTVGRAMFTTSSFMGMANGKFEEDGNVNQNSFSNKSGTQANA